MRVFRARAVAGLTALALVSGSLIGVGQITLASTTEPDPPTELTLIPEGTSEGPVVLTWTAPTNEEIERYQIFRYKGTGDPSADGLTYMAAVEGSKNVYFDEVPSEGSFQYAVIAVDDEGQASQPSEWASILVDIDGDGQIEPDNAPPGTPDSLDLGGDYSGSRSVTLTWEEQDEPDLWRFLVYRAEGDGERRLIGYVNGAESEFEETLPEDGSYTYSLVAQDTTGNASPASVELQVTVDTVAPEVIITSPEPGRTYTEAGPLTVTASIYEEGAGYTADNVEYFLNGTALESSQFDLATLPDGVHTVRVAVTDRAGNTGSNEVHFMLDKDQDELDPPQDVVVPSYRTRRTVPIRWSAPESAGVSSYLIYRTKDGQLPEHVGTTQPDVHTFVDTVPADGIYTYQVVARYISGSEAASAGATTTVDTADPVIRITSPARQEYTPDDERIAIAVEVADATSGVAEEAIRHYLDGELHTDAEIDLADLSDGIHEFKVVAVDRAGNRSAQVVHFRLTVDGDDDDDDDDDDDRDDDDEDEDEDEDEDDERDDLIEVLAEYRHEIAPGHFAALNAFARNGNMKAFRHFLHKFGNSRFISEDATEALLEAIGDEGSWPGKGKGKWKSRGPKG